MQALMTDPSSGQKEPTDLTKFFEFVKTSSTTPHTIIIDASTSYEVAELHPSWLLHGAHVVTANKRALSNSLSLYNLVYSAMRCVVNEVLLCLKLFLVMLYGCYNMHLNDMLQCLVLSY